MLEFIKKNLKVIIVLLLIPIIFIGILESFSEKITVDGWLGFLGGYLGVLGAVGAIWYQKNLDTKVAIKNIEIYSDYIYKTLYSRLESNSIKIITTFIPLSNIKIDEDIYKLKNDFNIINSEIINSNLEIILSNDKFFPLLSLKDELNDFFYYINLLEENKLSKDSFYELISNIRKEFAKYPNSNIIIENLISLDSILMDLKSNIFLEQLNFKRKDLSNYLSSLVDEITKVFANDKKTILDVLKCYQTCIYNLDSIVTLVTISNDSEINRKLQYYYNINLRLINTIIAIYEDIDKLKSTNQ